VETSAQQVTELLAALDILEDTHLIFSMPNADTGNKVIFNKIENFVATHANARAYTSLGQLRYLSCMYHVDGVVGNSSSGLAEMPSFKKGTINIGDRQKGRLKAESVIDCIPERQSILNAAHKLYSSDFQLNLDGVQNPYGQGGASEKILKVIRNYPLESLLKKSFYNLQSC
ncbi:MAG: UDP-N-acetylglucosamine 2-epimerase (hydrolyzing), partial [Deltaproteobacteria bacterium CG_4_10_14_0_2_um_filter_43_8]